MSGRTLSAGYISRLDRAGTGGNGAMKQERVIAILDFYRDIDKTVTMNERVIRNLEDQYYSTLGAVNSDGMPHGKGGVSYPAVRFRHYRKYAPGKRKVDCDKRRNSFGVERPELPRKSGDLRLLHRRASMGTSFATRKLQPAAMPKYPKHCAG